MKTMYLVKTYSDDVYRLDVIRETPKTLVITDQKILGSDRSCWDYAYPVSGHRIDRKTMHHDTFETLEDVARFIEGRFDHRIAAADAAKRIANELRDKFQSNWPNVVRADAIRLPEIKK
jgi:hypothetical protein